MNSYVRFSIYVTVPKWTNLWVHCTKLWALSAKPVGPLRQSVFYDCQNVFVSSSDGTGQNRFAPLSKKVCTHTEILQPTPT